MKSNKKLTSIKLDDKGGFQIKLRNKDIKPLKPKGFFVVELGNEIALFFTEDKVEDTEFKNIIFDSIIVLPIKKAEDISKVITDYIKMSSKVCHANNSANKKN